MELRLYMTAAVYDCRSFFDKVSVYDSCYIHIAAIYNCRSFFDKPSNSWLKVSVHDSCYI